jgi:mRNA interferase MazF
MDFPRRGEIYFVDFPVTGVGEMAGPHPALIVQNDVGNRASQLTIVAAITSNLRVARLPVGVQVSPKESGLSRPSVVHLGHLYTIDKAALDVGWAVSFSNNSGKWTVLSK